MNFETPIEAGLAEASVASKQMCKVFSAFLQ